VNTGADKYWGKPEYLVKGCGMGREATMWLLDRGVRVVVFRELDTHPEVYSARALNLIAWLFLGLAALVLVVAIAGALPDLVPGAMCGTGVLEATAGRGERALALRCLALLLLGAFRPCARLDAGAPEAPLLPTEARLLLLALPVTLLAGLDTWRALAALDVHAAVDCCAVVYDELSAGGPAVGVAAGVTASRP